MPEEEELNLKINPAVLQQVMDQIRYVAVTEVPRKLV